MRRVRARERSNLANNNNVTCTVATGRSKQTRKRIRGIVPNVQIEKSQPKLLW